MQEKKSKKSKFLLFAAALVAVSAVGLGTGACADGGEGSDSGNHQTDYSEISGARVNELVWKAAFSPAKYANASVKWQMQGVKPGADGAAEETAGQNIDLKVDANKAYLHVEESGKLLDYSLSYSSEKYLEYIKSDVPNVFFDQSAKIGAEDFNVYEKTGDEWQKYSLADDDADWEFDMSSPIFDVFFPDFSGKYKSGKYSEVEKGYVFENVEATVYSGLNGEFECESATFDKIVIKLVDGKAAAMQATIVVTSDGAEIKTEFSSVIYDIGTTKVDLPSSAASKPDEPDLRITKEAFFEELEKREKASLAAKKWATVNVTGTLTENGKVENIDCENLEIYHDPGDVSIVPVECGDGGISCFVFNYSTTKNDSMFTAESYEKDGDLLKAALKLISEDSQIQTVVIFNADGYVIYYKVIISANDTSTVYEFTFSGYSGKTEADLPSDQPGKAAKINSLLPSDKEIGKAYSEAYGEEVTEDQWREVFKEELYKNVSVNMSIWGENEYSDRGYFRYWKAGDLGRSSSSFCGDDGIESTFLFYVRKQGEKNEYLVPFDIDGNWRWYTEEEIEEKIYLTYGWDWNMFGYIVFGGLENQFSAFTFDPETGEYVANNISVTFLGTRLGNSLEAGKLALKIVDGKLTALSYDSMEGMSGCAVITDIGTTEINISDRVDSQAELDAAFYYLIDNPNVYYFFDSADESNSAYVQVEGDKAIAYKWPKRYYLGKVNGEERAYYYNNQSSSRELQQEDDDKIIRVEDLLSVFGEVYSGISSNGYNSASGLNGYDAASGMYVNNNFSYNGKAAVLRVKFFGGFVRYFEIDYGDTKDECLCVVYGDMHADLPSSAGFNFDEPDSGITKEAFFAELEKREKVSLEAKKWATVNVKGTVTENGKVENIDYKNLKIYHDPGDVSAVRVEFGNGGIACPVFGFSTTKNDPMLNKLTSVSYEKDGSFVKITWTIVDSGSPIQTVMIFNADGYATYCQIVMVENGTSNVYEFTFSGYSGEISED